MNNNRVHGYVIFLSTHSHRTRLLDTLSMLSVFYAAAKMKIARVSRENSEQNKPIIYSGTHKSHAEGNLN